MGVRKSIDKNHADFPEYMKKCIALGEQQEQELDAIGIPAMALDGPSTAIYKKYAAKLKRLQQEYAYLWKDE